MDFTILGAGTWGLTLSDILSKNGHNVSVWHYKKDYLKLLDSERYCQKMNASISSRIKFIPDDTIDDANIVVLCIPSQSVRTVLTNLNLKNRTYINASKGIENNTGKLITDIIAECISIEDLNLACLSGPSHAEELISGLPTVLSVASNNESLSKDIQSAFSNSFLRVYKTDCMNAMQVGGGVKNIISIASGICIGLGYGDNTIAALITRGLQEIIRFSKIYTANSESLTGISGMGDLIVTATSKHSRNKALGMLIGKGESLEDALVSINMVVEGVKTTESVYLISRQKEISMPICNEVYNVLFNRKDPQIAISELMSRELKSE